MLFDVFEKVFVISLARREDRLKAFMNGLPSDWPFRHPERFEAVNGTVSRSPDWWKGGNGAWGCYQSHLKVIETCLNSGLHSVLIFEDDAEFVERFTENVRCFFSHLPNDWNYIYLGGEHLQVNQRLPRLVNKWVYRPYNVNRCHAYGFRGRETLEAVYRHLSAPFPEETPHHVDHRLSDFQKQMDGGLYVPHLWLVHQAGGKSDICQKDLEKQTFPGAEELAYPKIDQTGIAILADRFGGGNLVAGILLSLGPDFHFDWTQANPQDFEDRLLGDICRNSFDERGLTDRSRLELENRTALLRRWAALQCRKHPNHRFFYGCHPNLSLRGREIIPAWNRPKFILVDRDPEETVRAARHRIVDPDTLRRTNALLRQARDDLIRNETPDVLRIPYEALVHRTESVVTSLYDFLEATPFDERIGSTVAVIRSQKDDFPFFHS